MTDFSRLRLRKSRNQYLVAPRGHTADAPHRVAPVFDRPVHQLAGDFRRHALTQPGVTMEDVSIDGRMLELIHRSSLFKFSSRISVMFMPLGEDRSTLAIYSRSQYGRRSTSRKRIDDWLAAIGAPEETAEVESDQRAESPASA